MFRITLIVSNLRLCEQFCIILCRVFGFSFHHWFLQVLEKKVLFVDSKEMWSQPKKTWFEPKNLFFCLKNKKTIGFLQPCIQISKMKTENPVFTLSSSTICKSTHLCCGICCCYINISYITRLSVQKTWK